MNNKSEKKFSPSFGFWPTKTGSGHSVFVTKELIETLANMKEGGRLFLQEVPEEKRTHDKIPSYKVTIFPPKEDAPTDGDSI